MIILKVSYRVRLNNLAEFEEIFRTCLMPLIKEQRLSFRGLSRCLVGNAGEYLEIWEFQSMADFETSWKRLMADPGVQEIFEKTGPLVEDENHALFEPVIQA